MLEIHRCFAHAIADYASEIENLTLDINYHVPQEYIKCKTNEDFYLEIDNVKFKFDLDKESIDLLFHKSFSQKCSRVEKSKYGMTYTLRVDNLRIASDKRSLPLDFFVMSESVSYIFDPSGLVLVHSVPLTELNYEKISSFVTNVYYDYDESPTSDYEDEFLTDAELFYHFLTHSKAEHLIYLSNEINYELKALIENEVISILIDSKGINTIVLENNEN